MSEIEQPRVPSRITVSPQRSSRCHGDWRREKLHALTGTDADDFDVDLYVLDAISFYVIISTQNCSIEDDMKSS
jgi:hypothetical protein